VETRAQGPIECQKRIGRVSRIAIYPVKGCRRVELQSASVGPTGLRGDREYMVVRQETEAGGVHPFLTQRDKRNRQEPRPQSLAILGLIVPQITETALTLTWRGSDPVVVSREALADGDMKVRIHKEVVSAVDQGDAIAKWLSDHLEVNARLVRAAGAFNRLAGQSYMQNTNRIAFQDAYPIHWLMEESVAELSRIAGQEIPWTRFRPNIVGEGGEPQIEHEIFEGTMGELRFVQPKPCTRCPVTTVDQEAGEKRGNEPLTTLSGYKRWDRTRESLFGENMFPLNGGTLTLGDEILEVRARNPPLSYGRQAQRRGLGAETPEGAARRRG